ncbi:N-acetylmuramoyl-L-alanine amidase [Anoxynatronum sibiricum]|uniref:N-acetylmuramoyl-L-alanine amidase n=1 Tax=Anoxynatronum sibiricum TaxID=210623 RepID=A0ABU9VX49_9CLOT
MKNRLLSLIVILVAIALGVSVVDIRKEQVTSQVTSQQSSQTTADNTCSTENATDIKIINNTMLTGTAPRAPEDEPDNTITNDTNSEASYIVCIDPGHQAIANYEHERIGPNTSEMKIKVSQGTKGVHTQTMEYELNLQASILLKELLEEKGIKVLMTRTTNEVNISNKERAEIANNFGADLFVRIHADGASNQSIRGAHVLIPDESHPTPGVYSASKKAAMILLEHLDGEGIHLLSSPLSKRSDISGFNWSEVPVFLLEMGFMTNPEEDKMMSDFLYQRKLMNITADAIEEFLMKDEVVEETSP